MDFSVLGPLRVANGAGPIEVPGAKERALLAHLVARRGSMVPASEIIDALWGDEPPRSAAKSVQTFVARLRNVLDPERASGAGVILTEGPGYRLDVDASAVDAERFVGLLTVGRTALRDGRDRVASEALGDALALWRGPAYAGFETASWAQAEARRLEELRLDAADDLLAVRLDLGHTAEVIAEAERRLGEQPLRERIWCLLVLALYRAGRQADALAAYERARTTLAEELGVDPGPELRELHAKVLAHDPALRGRAQSAALPAELQVRGDGFVGREDELERLRELWASVEAGGSVSVAVRGPEGAGASRLAAELARGVARSGASVAFVGPSTPPSGRMPLGSPALVVADHVVAESPQHGMLLRLVDAGEVAAGVDEVIDLQPLAEAEIRLLAAKYVPAADLDAAVAEVRSAGAAWPGVVHDGVAQRARRLATQQVESAVRTATVSREALVSARDALSDGVETLAESARADVTPSDEAPWPGLQPYGQDEARFFAGRERLVAELVARLATTRLLAVVGASGTGKSSLVQAGLVPALEVGVLPGSASWVRLTMRPGSAPLRELARVALGGRQVDVGDVLAQLLSRAGGHDATAEGASPRTILVVDQFEEVWTSGADDAQVADFLRVLVDAVDDPAGRVSVVVVLRADYLTAVAEHPELARRLSESTVLVGAPTPDEVRRAIERPAERARLALEDGLADAIVADAGAEPGLLPLLSTSMRRLWEDRSAGMLTFASYVGSGGLRGAIAGLAEDAFTSLPDAQREAARTLLLRLAGPGEGVAVTRRRVSLAELEALPSKHQRGVADRLADARLLTISDGHVEVAHEALFREWPRLAGWLAEDASSRAVQRRLTLAANEWDAEGREDGALWRGTRLSSALELVAARPDEVTSVEREFVEAGKERVEAEQREVAERAARTARQNRRLRSLLIGAAVLLVVALAAGLLAWRSSAEATAASERATAASIAADAKRLAATALNEEYPDLAMLSAIEAVRTESSPETHGALLTLLARSQGVFARVRTPGRLLHAGATRDGRTVFLGDNGNSLLALDAVTGEERWSISEGDGQHASLVTAPDDSVVMASRLGSPALVEARRVVDGSVAWSIVEAAIRAATKETKGEPVYLAGDATWLEDNRIFLPTDSHWLLIDGAAGRVVEAHPWADGRAGDYDVVDWGDGRVSFSATGEGQSETLLLDLARPAAAPVVIPGHALALSPDRSRLVTSTTTPDESRTVLQVRDATTFEPIGAPVPQPSFVRGLRWVGDVIVVGTEQTVRLHDAGSGDLLRQVDAHSGAVIDLVVAGPDLDLVWTAGRDATAVGIDLSGRRGAVREGTTDFPPNFVGGDAVGQVVAGVLRNETAPNDAFVGRTDGTTIHAKLPLSGCERCQVAHATATPDGSTVLAAIEQFTPDIEPMTDRGYVAQWDVDTGELVALHRTPWPAYALDVTTDGTRVVVNGRSGWGVIDLRSGRFEVQPEPTGEIRWWDAFPLVSVSPDGRNAALARGQKLVVIDVATRAVVRTRDFPDDLSAVAWLPGRDVLAVGDMGGHVHFVSTADLTDLAPRRLVVGGWLLDLEADATGRWMASLGTDGDVLLWDLEALRPLGKPVSDGKNWGLVWIDAATSTMTAAYEYGRRVDVGIDPVGWLRDGCRLANRDLTPEESAIIRPGQPLRSTCDGLT